MKKMTAKNQALADMRAMGINVTLLAYDKTFSRKQFTKDVKDIKSNK